MPEADETAWRLRQQLTVFAQAGIDQLVLGCTHYPFFKGFLLEEIARQQLSIQIVDSGQAIAERVKQLLLSNQLLASANIKGNGNNHINEYCNEYCNDDSNAHRAIATNHQISPVVRLPLTFYASKYDDTLGALIKQLVGQETVLQYASK